MLFWTRRIFGAVFIGHLLCAVFCSAEEKEEVQQLPEIMVAADSLDQRPILAADSTARHLEFLPTVLLQSQGDGNRQNDLSIRGSSFSGAGIAVNGMTLKNPQTEHFNAELPLPVTLFWAPEVLTGFEQAQLADANLAGTVRFQFMPAAEGGYIEAGVGERARNREAFLYDRELPGYGEAGALAIGAFGMREQAKGLDYGDNDLDLWRAGGRAQYRTAVSQTDLAFGKQRKKFGARGYYGVSPEYFAEEEIKDSLVLATSRIDCGGGGNMRINAMWRQIDDDYKLWLPDFLYHNQHQSTIQKAGFTGHNPVSSLFDLNWAIDGSSEDIDSNSLGDHWRERAGMNFLPSLHLAELTLSAGTRAEAYSADSPAWLPQAGAEYALTDNAILYASYTETTRLPSYTELNYESPGSLGNSGLDRQESSNSEVGVKTLLSPAFSVRLAGFSRRSENTVDWLKPEAGDRWIASDLGLVETAGMETALLYHPDESRFYMDINYLYIDKTDTVNAYASRYALDYARHLIQCVAGWTVTRHLFLTARQGLRWQVENNERTGADFGSPATIETQWVVPSLPSLSLNVGIDNIWNDHFQQIPGQRAGDRAAFISARWLL